MFIKDDTTFADTMEKSYLSWLDEMEKHEDIAVRDGVRLARDYVSHLKEENKRLKESNELTKSFLKKMKEKEK